MITNIVLDEFTTRVVKNTGAMTLYYLEGV